MRKLVNLAQSASVVARSRLAYLIPDNEEELDNDNSANACVFIVQAECCFRDRQTYDEPDPEVEIWQLVSRHQKATCEDHAIVPISIRAVRIRMV